MPSRIKVNGSAHTVDVDGDTPLLWVLRDVLGMTGTKFGCGMALCGACTVHVDGAPTRSCVTPVDCVGASKITTIEAIGEDSRRRQHPEGVARPRGRSMRLLPVGPDHVRGGAAREQSASDRCRHRRRDVRQHLPLRDLCAHSRSDQAGRESVGGRNMTMITSQAAVADQPSDSVAAQVPAGGAAAGGGLLLGLSLPAAGGQEQRTTLRPERVHPHRRRRTDRPDHAVCRDGAGHLHLDPDADRRGAGGRSSIRCGSSTRRRTKSSMPIRCSAMQATGNSNAIRGAWKPLREAGATARTMLVAAAAKRWNVDPASCRAQSGEVLHAPTGRRIKYGAARGRCGAHAGARRT